MKKQIKSWISKLLVNSIFKAWFNHCPLIQILLSYDDNTEASAYLEGERGRRSPLPFSKIGKKCPNAVIVVIYGLNFSFKIQFLRISTRKNRRFFPAGPFFFVLYMIVYQSVLTQRKLPCPKKFLVTHQQSPSYCSLTFTLKMP